MTTTDWADSSSEAESGEASSGASWSGRLGLLHARTRTPALLFVIVMALLSIERAALLLSVPERFSEASAADLAWAFAVGLRFDIVMAGMLVAPLLAVLSFAWPALLERRLFKWIIAGYVGAAAAGTALLCAVDMSFFLQFTERLNDKALKYVGREGNEYVLHLIWSEYPVLLVFAGVMGTALAAAWLARRVGFDDRRNVGPLWQAIVWPGLAAALLALGIRGTVSSHAINTSPAYFSPHAPVAQLTLNGGFTLRQAVVSAAKKTVDLARMYPLLDPEEAAARVRELARSPQDEFVNDGANPLHRITRTGRPRRDANVVLVVLESLSWHYIGALGGDARLTPNLNGLAEDGLLFTRCFANGGRTQRGFAGLLSGYPDLPEYSVTTRIESLGRFITLGSVLKRRGYETMFVYAGPGNRDHRQSFMGSNGFDRFVTEDDTVTQTLETKLGYADEDLFNTAHAVFEEAEQPFLATMLTLSFHEPFTIPPDRIDPVDPDDPHARQLDAIRYTDWAIGRFMEQARRSAYFDDTIFVFVADHMGGYRQNPNTPDVYRVPFLIYGPGVIGSEGRRIDRVCSQMDVAPTLLWLLGGAYEHCFFGSSVLGPGGDRRYGFALTGPEELLFYDRRGRIAFVPPHGGERRLFQYTAPDQIDPIALDTPEARHQLESMSRDAISVIQTAHEMFDRGTYHLGGGDARRSASRSEAP